jgi:hypothetical protein
MRKPNSRPWLNTMDPKKYFAPTNSCVPKLASWLFQAYVELLLDQYYYLVLHDFLQVCVPVTAPRYVFLSLIYGVKNTLNIIC